MCDRIIGMNKGTVFAGDWRHRRLANKIMRYQNFSMMP